MAKTVLIVEDDELNLKFFNDLLTSEGYRTRLARTGADALDSARAERPDLVLLDIELPGRSGLEIADEMRRDSRLADVPLVAVTAHAMEGDEDQIRRRGCIGYIPKPVTMDGFLSTVRRHLH